MLTAMAEPTENLHLVEAEKLEESDTEGDKLDPLALVEAFEKTLDIQQDVELTKCVAVEEKKTELGDKQQDEPTVCPPAESSTARSKWAVGAECQAVWPEDGQVYPATIISLDGESCRVHFKDYGNEEDMQLSALKSLDLPPAQNNTLDWKPGSRCRAVYSADGLVYPAAVLWVKGQRCRVRFDDYNNEEEQDVGSLLAFDELNGPSRATAVKGSNWKSSLSSSSSDWKRRRREEGQGERGAERRQTWRDDQQASSSSSWLKERPGHHSRVEKESEEKRKTNPPRDGADKPTTHSFSLFPPFPPPPQCSVNPLAFIPPPLGAFGGKEAGASSVDATSSMLMLWYMCGFHTGSYMAQQQFKSTSTD